jgi:hypothetical protein
VNYWWYDRPPPSDREAIDKVFEMARELTGMLSATDRDDWRMWLARTKEHLKNKAVVGDCERCKSTGVLVRPVVVGYVETTNGEEAVSQTLCATCSGAAIRSEKRCSICRTVGHRSTTCPLNVDRIAVDVDERAELARLKAKYPEEER